MKLAVLYHSETGNTLKAGEYVKAGMEKVQGIEEVKMISIDDAKQEDFDDVVGVAIGAPTYLAEASWQMVKFLEVGGINISDKLGCAFSTGNFSHGGTEIVLQNLNSIMLAKGMTVYSGGCTHGMPLTHIGANAFVKNAKVEDKADVLEALGEKFAKKAVEYFSNK